MATHPVTTLVERLAGFGPYPAGVGAVAGPLPRTGFFPGGLGLWNPDGGMPALPDRPFMIVGHNWGTTEDHRAALAVGTEYDDHWPEPRRRGQPTWWNLLRILRGAGIDPAGCFFTNALMGLKDDGGGNVGPISADTDYRRRCTEFLEFQIAALRPRAVVALGSEAKSALAVLSSDLADWRGSRGGELGIAEIRRRGKAVVRGVRFVAAPPCAAAVICHPCDPRNLSPDLAEECSAAAEAGKG